MIPYAKHNISNEDIDAVVTVLKSDFITQGNVVPAFERLVAGKVDANYAVAVNSATSALHLACLSLGARENDYLWTTPNTFVASANCALYCGSKIDFVDIDPQTYNMSVIALEEKLIKAKNDGVLPKIIIPVHFSGQSCEMDKIYQLSNKYGFKIIEDASHAIGGKYKGEMIGNCKYSDITIFSFHPAKIVTTGEGGMAVTNNKRLAAKIELLRSHGITRDPNEMTQQPDGDWYYQQIDLGYNYRMTDFQAALGISQMNHLESFISSRREIALYYDSKFCELDITIPYQRNDVYSVFHLYVILLPTRLYGSHKKIFKHLRDEGIGVNLHYIPLYRQPYYQSLGHTISCFPNAEKYYKSAISLPIYPSLKEKDVTKISRLLINIIANESNP